MATQKVLPDPGALERQNRNQRRRSTRRKVGAYGLVGAIVVIGIVAAAAALRSNDSRRPASQPTTTSTPIPRLPTTGALKPGTYVIRTLDRDFDASHRITVDIPDGYEAKDGFAVLKIGRRDQIGVSAWVIGGVYSDPCHWGGTFLNPPVGQRFDALVAALASQKGFQVSTPADVTVGGFAGKYMERIVPSGTNPTDCSGGQFRPWLASDGGERNVGAGQHDLLWVVDVDGAPLVIDAALEAGASAQVRAELLRIVESVRIDPR